MRDIAWKGSHTNDNLCSAVASIRKTTLNIPEAPKVKCLIALTSSSAIYNKIYIII